MSVTIVFKVYYQWCYGTKEEANDNDGHAPLISIFFIFIWKFVFKFKNWINYKYWYLTRNPDQLSQVIEIGIGVRWVSSRRY